MHLNGGATNCVDVVGVGWEVTRASGCTYMVEPLQCKTM